MPLTVEQILEILRLVDSSQCEEFRLETADVKLVVRKGGTGPHHAAESDAPTPAREDVRAPAPVGEPERDAAAPSDIDAVPDGLVAIRAPMVGTFYRAPAPGAPPFVEVGSVVKESDTVCILEVMKLMNSLVAGVRGRVRRICAENATLVSHGQVLVLIEPDEIGERTA
jgi:acetyl-CoA carboxylase biotin carboxyl carrier protein